MEFQFQLHYGTLLTKFGSKTQHHTKQQHDKDEATNIISKVTKTQHRSGLRVMLGERVFSPRYHINETISYKPHRSVYLVVWMNLTSNKTTTHINKTFGSLTAQIFDRTTRPNDVGEQISLVSCFARLEGGQLT